MNWRSTSFSLLKIQNMEVASHPGPKCILIYFVLVYKDLTISYNRFGQRLGQYRELEEQTHRYACTFFDSDRVYIALQSDLTLVLTPELVKFEMLQGNSTDRFYEDETKSLADLHSEFDIHYHFHEQIQPYYSMLEALRLLNADRSILAKYHVEFFLDLYACFKIAGLKNWRSDLPDQILERIKEEMIQDLYLFPRSSEFETLNDIIWDELRKLPIIQSVLSLRDLDNH